jgi:hypothetical protein
MSPRLPLLALLAAAVCGPGLRAAQLAGRVEGDTYYSANGVFKIRIPVLSAMGGTVTDTPNEVTFKDGFTTYISIVAFPMDALQRWELSTKGTRDYLVTFFDTYVRPNFERSFKTVQFERDGIFAPKLMDGAFFTFVLLPGGSMFPFPAGDIDPNRPKPTAKRGNLLFVKNGTILVISAELGERSTEGTAYSLTPAEEDLQLREELTDVAKRMTFLADSSATAPAPANPPAHAGP